MKNIVSTGWLLRSMLAGPVAWRQVGNETVEGSSPGLELSSLTGDGTDLVAHGNTRPVTAVR